MDIHPDANEVILSFIPRHGMNSVFYGCRIRKIFWNRKHRNIFEFYVRSYEGILWKIQRLFRNRKIIAILSNFLWLSCRWRTVRCSWKTIYSFKVTTSNGNNRPTGKPFFGNVHECTLTEEFWAMRVINKYSNCKQVLRTPSSRVIHWLKTRTKSINLSPGK